MKRGAETAAAGSADAAPPASGWDADEHDVPPRKLVLGASAETAAVTAVSTQGGGGNGEVAIDEAGAAWLLDALVNDLCLDLCFDVSLSPACGIQGN